MGLSGISVGLGARLPNLRETDPSKIAVGFGGTLNLLVSLVFIFAIVTALAVPCHLYFLGQEHPETTTLALSHGGFRFWLTARDRSQSADRRRRDHRAAADRHQGVSADGVLRSPLAGMTSDLESCRIRLAPVPSYADHPVRSLRGFHLRLCSMNSMLSRQPSPARNRLRGDIVLAYYSFAEGAGTKMPCGHS